MTAPHQTKPNVPSRSGIRYAACAVVLLIVALLISNIHQLDRPNKPAEPNRGLPPAVEPLTAIVERHAPFIYASTDPSAGRQDLISNIDFDGDVVGNNNWENFERFELKPTVYYSILETHTHYFIAYHLFHPRDWNSFTFWLNDTHENDGENFQIVIRKIDDRIVLLWTQAHYRGSVYANAGSGIESGLTRVEGEFQTVDFNGALDPNGAHPCIYVESEGHGIFGTLGRDSEVSIRPNGEYNFKSGSGLLFRPRRNDELVTEPLSTTSGEVAYQLDSITLKLWPVLRDGYLTGDGKLLDGSYSYRDELIEIKEVPRFYDGNRISGPLGSDRGISPFALDLSFSRGSLGALFFNPARRYQERLIISGDWSREYLNYPFRR